MVNYTCGADSNEVAADEGFRGEGMRDITGYSHEIGRVKGESNHEKADRGVLLIVLAVIGWISAFKCLPADMHIYNN